MQQQPPRSVLWCNREGDPTTYSGPVPSIESVAQGLVFASPDMLKFRHPNHFPAGNLNSCLEYWGTILQDSPFQDFVLPIISHGVVISDYFQPFQGIFLQQFYDSNFPPRKIFLNSKSCASFEGFITDTIMGRVRNGSLTVVGRVGEVEPPHLVLPITIEPKKPRMCHDERFLNLWIKDCPFTLDYITDLPRYIDQDHYQTTFDEKWV